jgi:hypothetical protein
LLFQLFLQRLVFFCHLGQPPYSCQFILSFIIAGWRQLLLPDRQRRHGTASLKPKVKKKHPPYPLISMFSLRLGIPTAMRIKLPLF